MAKLFFVSVLSLVFAFFMLGCQNAMNPSELQEQNSPEQNTLEPQCEEPTVEPQCCPPPLPPPDCGTPGYWKNHPDAWPVDEITIGGITYSKEGEEGEEGAIDLMSQPVKRDKSITMFKALVAAKLNSLIGCGYTCIEDIIVDADTWMSNHPVGSEVKANSEAWQQGDECDDGGEDLYWALDEWNNDGC